MRKQTYYIYITTNPNRTVLYIGVTNHLARRLVEHYANRGLKKTFAGKYYAYQLIYFEEFTSITKAIAREKELKKWNRKRKEELIATINPSWKFLNESFCQEWPPLKIWGNYFQKFKNQTHEQQIALNKNKHSTDKNHFIYEIPKDTFSQKTVPVPSSPPVISQKPKLPQATQSPPLPPVISQKPKLPKEAPKNFPKETVPSSIPSKADFNRELQKHLPQYLKNTKSRSHLTQRERDLITIAILVTLDKKEELTTHLQTIQKTNIKEEDVQQVLLHISIYTGIFATKEAMKLSQNIFNKTPTIN